MREGRAALLFRREVVAVAREICKRARRTGAYVMSCRRVHRALFYKLTAPRVAWANRFSGCKPRTERPFAPAEFPAEAPSACQICAQTGPYTTSLAQKSAALV